MLNFDKQDYGSGASTWRIVSSGRWTFFTNQKGLLLYDGVNWHKYPLNNGSEARGVAVFPKSKRIYLGGENEFGYLKVSPSGDLKYQCLSEKLPAKYGRIGNVFEIYDINHSIYLRGDNHILVITGNHYTRIDSHEKMFSSVCIGGVIYVATDNGIYMLVGQRFVPIAGNDQLKGKRINAMAAYGKGFIVGTVNDGIYYCDDLGIRPLHTPADALLKSGDICSMAIRKGKLAVGTIHNGIVIVDLLTGYVQTFDQRNGLQNCTVLSIAFDDNGNIWAGLDYGIDYVMLESPFSCLYHSTDSYGIGYSALISGNYLYFGTDRGLYYTHYPVSFSKGQPAISFVPGTSGPAWMLHKHGNDIFCLHDRGLFLVRDGSASKITNIQGAWSCLDVKGRPDLMFVGVYDGIYLLRKVAGSWVSQGKISGITESGRFIKQISPRQIKRYEPNAGLATIYTLDASLTRAISHKTIKERYVNESTEMVEKMFHKWDITGKIMHINNKFDIIPYDRGFMLMNKNKVRKSDHNVYIDRIYITSGKDSLVYESNIFNEKIIPEISYNYNSVRIEFDVNKLSLASSAQFQYRLNGEKWSGLSNYTSKEYSDLSEGQYLFEVRAIFMDGTKSTARISFRILPPWYRTWPAYLFYIALLVTGIWFAVKYTKRYLKNKEQAALAEKNEQIDRMNDEITQLERDKIDLDLRHKSQQIANLVLNVARKNEILTSIRDQIKSVVASIGTDSAQNCKQQLLIINSHIDSSMEGDEVLKEFEEQFDLVNNNFIKKLSERYPSLNHNEKMMCAYLKMNLSTKEIAPLMNISVRGVETIRYRLRKKLGIDRNDNLTEFINNLK